MAFPHFGKYLQWPKSWGQRHTAGVARIGGQVPTKPVPKWKKWVRGDSDVGWKTMEDNNWKLLERSFSKWWGTNSGWREDEDIPLWAFNVPPTYWAGSTTK